MAQLVVLLTFLLVTHAVCSSIFLSGGLPVFHTPLGFGCAVRGVRHTTYFLGAYGQTKIIGGVPGPLGTCWLSRTKSFYGPGGNRLPNHYFVWKKSKSGLSTSFVIKPQFTKKIVPHGFWLHGDMLSSSSGLTYHTVLGYTYFFNDFKTRVPNHFIKWSNSGGLYLDRTYERLLVPHGFKHRYDVLYSPNGMYVRFLPKTHKYNVFYPSGKRAPWQSLRWYSRAFFLKENYKLIKGSVHKVLPGPKATYLFRNKYYGCGGNQLPSNYFYWKGKGYSIKKFALSKLYPQGYYATDKYLVGSHFVYYWAPESAFKILGDLRYYLPTKYFYWTKFGGFKVRAMYVKKLYPADFTFRNGRLFGQSGMVAWYNAPKDELSYFHHGRYVNGTEMLHWTNGGYYLKYNSRIVGGRIVRVWAGAYGTYYYKNRYFDVGGHRVPANFFSWADQSQLVVKPKYLWRFNPKGYEWSSGSLINWSNGVYFKHDTSSFKTLGDLYSSLPASWFYWKKNGGFSIRRRYAGLVYPKSHHFANRSLYGPYGIRYSWNAKARIESFFSRCGNRIPMSYFYWEGRVWHVKPYRKHLLRKCR